VQRWVWLCGVSLLGRHGPLEDGDESDTLHSLVKDLDQIDVIMPQILQQFPPLIATVESVQTMTLTMHKIDGTVVLGGVERLSHGGAIYVAGPRDLKPESTGS
jgi:hypothetical protein